MRLATKKLKIKAQRHVQHAEEWEELVRVAWTLLYENPNLISFAVCSLTGNRNADCIVRKIRNQEPKIILSDNKKRAAKGARAAATSAPGNYVPLLFPLGGFVAPFTVTLGPTQIRLFTLSEHNITSFTLFHLEAQEHDRLLASLSVAATLLHEVSHLCLRNIGDKFSKDCRFGCESGAAG